VVLALFQFVSFAMYKKGYSHILLPAVLFVEVYLQHLDGQKAVRITVSLWHQTLK